MYIKIWSAYITPKIEQKLAKNEPKNPKRQFFVSFWPKFEISSAQTFLKFYANILQNDFFRLNDEILLENAIFTHFSPINMAKIRNKLDLGQFSGDNLTKHGWVEL